MTALCSAAAVFISSDLRKSGAVMLVLVAMFVSAAVVVVLLEAFFESVACGLFAMASLC